MKSANFISAYETAKGLLSTIAQLLFGLSCVLLFLTILTLSSPVYIFRWIIIHLVKYLRPDLGRALNPLSVVMARELHFPSRAPRANIVNIAPLDGILDVAEFEKLVMDKWIHAKAQPEESGQDKNHLKYPQFSQFPVSWLGILFWKSDTNFNIKNHIYTHPKGTDTEINELVEELLNAPHHPSRSPWEFHIIQAYQNPDISPDKISILILKFHHSLCDGYSILSAFSDLYGQTEFEKPQFRTPKRSSGSFLEWIGHILALPLTGAIELAKHAPGCFKDNPWKIPDKEKAWHQLYSRSELIPVQEIKHIKNTFGVSFTSVLLSGISAGIHKNLKGKRINGNKSRCRDNQDKSMTCVSILPLPGKGRREGLTNHATGVFFDIPARSFSSPIERLHECNQVLEATKNSIIPMFFASYLDSLGGHFRWVQSFFMRNQTVSTGLTNFPSVGTDFKGTLIGRSPLLSHTATGGLEGAAGVIFTVVSFREHIRIAVVAEQGLMSRIEVDDLVKHVEGEIHNLYSLSNSNELRPWLPNKVLQILN